MEAVLIFGLDTLNYVLAIALVALGLVIVFGLMRVINMAHGEFFLLGAYCVVTVHGLGGSFWLGLCLAPIAVGLVGLVAEELVVRFVYRRFLDSILATWGLSLAIKQAVVLTFGPGSQQVALPIDGSVLILTSEYPIYRLFIMAMALLAIGFTYWLFLRTQFGLMARAATADRDMAAVLGIDTRRLDRLTFVYGAALAGFAGAVIAPIMSVDPHMGLGFLVPAFLAVLVGGAGHLGGALLGAGVIGGTDSATAAIWSPVVAQIVVFTMAVIVIRLFPGGLLGPRRN
jgi:branched-chain amino acid transport system permease protein/urea transport system permease protein